MSNLAEVLIPNVRAKPKKQEDGEGASSRRPDQTRYFSIVIGRGSAAGVLTRILPDWLSQAGYIMLGVYIQIARLEPLICHANKA